MKNKLEVEERMKAGGITTASFATVDSNGIITPEPEDSKNTVFQCASLSKPVFAYLVLKLIETNQTRPGISPSAKKGLGKFNQFDTKFGLKTPLYEVFRDKQGRTLPDNENPFLKQFSNPEQAKQLTTEMVLSHTTGLPIVGKQPYQFQFESGTHYAYSGPGIECLQGVIKELTGGADLELLAQEHIFGKQALDMPNSTYGANPVAANSLKTTAEEYTKFITAWINDDKLNYAFNPIKPADSMINDYFPNPKSSGRLVENITIENSDRNRVAWGLGIGLVKNDQGQIIGAFHTGDMGDDSAEWRAGVGATIDPKSKRCIEASVYLTKSPNGHILAEQVLPDILKPALNYFFPTYGFARNSEELDGTNFHGMNPKILKPDLKEMAYKTKTTTQHVQSAVQSVEHPSKLPKAEESITDSTKRMLQQMHTNPLSSKPELRVKTVKSQEQESADKSIQEIEEPKEDKIQEERKFNPTPFSTSYEPDKK